MHADGLVMAAERREMVYCMADGSSRAVTRTVRNQKQNDSNRMALVQYSIGDNGGVLGSDASCVYFCIFTITYILGNAHNGHIGDMCRSRPVRFTRSYAIPPSADWDCRGGR